MSELNPNHQVTQAIRNQWHVIVAIMMKQQGLTEIVITEGDIMQVMNSEGGTAVSAQELPDGLHIRIHTMQEAVLMAAQHGGLPS